MDQGIQSAIAALQRTLATLDAKRERIQDLIRQLQAEDGKDSPAVESLASQPAPSPADLTPGAIAAIITALDRINENDYPIESLKGLTRLGVARKVARNNDGYITAFAFRKILARSGVLRGDKQITSNFQSRSLEKH
jgi:hypothetical protein